MTAATVGRWFVRCVDCLSVSAVEDVRALPVERTTSAIFPVCGACGGRLENMGQVGRDGRLGFKITESVCDHRCTSARGPACACVCRGKNHGSGRVREVRIVTGAPPAVTPEDPAGALRRAEEFRAAATSFRAAHDRRFGDVIERKSRGWIPDFPVYLAAMAALKPYHAARAARTHASRMAAIARAAAALEARS